MLAFLTGLGLVTVAYYLGERRGMVKGMHNAAFQLRQEITQRKLLVCTCGRGR